MHKLRAFLPLLLGFCLWARADDISGTIGADQILDLAGSPWHVTGTVTVSSGVTLSVDPGVELIFDGNFDILVYGAFNVNGTAGQPVSIHGSGTPSWRSLRYYTANLPSNIDYATIVDGGTYASYGVIQVYQSVLDLSNVTIQDATYDGLMVQGGADLQLDNVNINGTRYPIHLNNGAIVFEIVGPTNLTGNDYDQIYCDFSSVTQDLDLDAADVAYQFYHSVTVDNGFKLTLNPGLVLKMRTGRYIYVHGAFESAGTLADPNYITSIRDDNIAGDSNGDGAGTSPAAGNWESVYFYDDSDDLNCALSYTTVRFGDSSVYMDNAGPALDHCEFTNSHYPVHITGTSAPAISDCNFAVATYTPIYMSLSSNPTMTNNDFSTSNNGYDAIGIIPETLSANGHLPVRDFTSVPNVTYVIFGNITVPLGFTLTIDPEVVIKWTNYTHGINVEGDLDAQGTAVDQIVMTSVKDDNFGNPADTNNDGSITAPAAGDWRGIYFQSGATGTLDNVLVHYAGGYWHVYDDGYYRYAGVAAINSSPVMDECTFFNNNRHGVILFGNCSSPVSDCVFQNHTYSPIAVSAAATPVLSGNSFSNNSYTTLGLLGENLGTNATIDQRTVAGYANITWLLEELLTVESGTQLTVDPGVVIKMFGTSVGIEVEGGLDAVGSGGNEIVFTSYRDDNYGNPADSNNDGNGTLPAYNNWRHLNFLPSADDPNCLVQYCWLGYAGYSNEGAVRCESSAPTIQNTTISDSYYGVSIRGNSGTTVDQCLIQNCNSTPIYMSVTSNPTLSFDNTFTNNGYFALGIINEALSTTASLPQRNVAGVNNFTYLFLSDFYINSGGSLTFEEGVTAKFLGNVDIRSHGAFHTLGTALNRVHMTSYRDDSVGGDTNDDGSSTSPAVGNWGVVVYYSDSDPLSVMEHTVIRFGGYTSGTYGQIYIDGSDPTIRDCEITNCYWGFELLSDAAPTLQDNVLVNLNYAPVYMSVYSNPVFSGNAFFNVGQQAIQLRGETISVDLNLSPRNFGGYTNITYYLSANMTVASTTTWTIDPTVVLKLYGPTIYVNGALVTDDVVLTSLRDDDYGNPLDTEDNGSGTSPTYSNWGGIDFNDISMDGVNHIQNTTIRYCYYPVECINAAPSVTGATLEQCNYGVVLNGNSPAVLTAVTIQDCNTAPAYQSLVTDADYTGTTFGTGNTYNGVYIRNETLAQDITLRKESAANVDNLPWILNGLTVGSSSVLTIEPGVVVKHLSGGTLGVHKGISAIGGSAPEDQIVFTYIEDDFYGGDTNGDGDATEPTAGEGNFTIYFYSDAWDALCSMDYCVLAYGGYSNYRGMIDIQSAGPAITNCVIRDGDVGVSVSGSSNPTVNDCDIAGNNYYGMINTNPAITVDAENNWWGDATGPYDGSDDTGTGGLYNPGGLGDEVSDYVDYDPWASSLQHPMLGDVSLNGEIHAFDASLILSWIADPVGNPLTPVQLAVADVTGNAVVNATDAHYILQYVVGSELTFPGEMTDYPGEPFDPESELISSIDPAGDGEWVITYELVGENTTRGFHLDCWFDSGELEVLEVLPGAELNYSLRWHAEDGLLRLAMAAMQLPGEIPLSVELRVASAVEPGTDFIEATRFVVNDEEFLLGGTGVEEPEAELVFALHPNYPNPFNPATRIRFDLPEPQEMSLKVYNIRGQLVRDLADADFPAGRHAVIWDGSNDTGTGVASGLYLLRLESEKYHAVRRMTLLK